MAVLHEGCRTGGRKSLPSQRDGRERVVRDGSAVVHDSRHPGLLHGTTGFAPGDPEPFTDGFQKFPDDGVVARHDGFEQGRRIQPHP